MRILHTLGTLLFRCFLLCFGLFFVFFGSSLIQEQKSLPILQSILQLTLSQTKIEKVDADFLYITHTAGGRESMIDFMKGYGYEIKDQMGSGYFFEKDSQIKITITSRQFSRFFTLWKIYIRS